MHSPMLPVDPIIRANLKAWLAHHRKFQYVQMPAIEHENQRDPKLRFAPHFRQHRMDTKRYTGSQLRILRAARGIGLIKRHVSQQQQLRMELPWTYLKRVIAFDLSKDERGKPFFAELKIMRGGNYGSKQRRDRRLENQMTQEQWFLLVKSLAARLFPKDDGGFGSLPPLRA